MFTKVSQHNGTHQISVGHDVSIKVSDLAYEKLELIASIRNSKTIHLNNMSKRTALPLPADCTAEAIAGEAFRRAEVEMPGFDVSGIEEKLPELIETMFDEAMVDMMPKPQARPKGSKVKGWCS